MSKEEKQSMMDKMMDKFFASMTQDEKKEMLAKMMPRMMDKMFEGMTSKDRSELMTTMMPTMMSQMFSDTSADQRSSLMGQIMPKMMSRMFGREGEMPPTMTQMMKSMTSNGKAKESQVPTMETHGDFKPWEFCPCRKLCQEAFNKKPSN
jgi:Mg/Co/Ni transporter MgtE